MHTTIMKFRPAAWALGVAVAALACSTAWAADAAPATTRTNTSGKPDAAMQAAQTRFEQDKAACMAGKSNQDQQTCLKEAGAAYEQTKRGTLNDRGAPYDANARKRCESLPTNDKQACLARMDGAGTKSGSEATGGIYRELTVTTPAAPAKAETAGADNTPQQAPKK